MATESTDTSQDTSKAAIAPLTVLALYAQSSFWSMGEGKGATAFTRTLDALARRGHKVHVSLPKTPETPSKPEYPNKPPVAPSDAPRGATPENPNRFGATDDLDASTHGYVRFHPRPGARFLPNPDLPWTTRIFDRYQTWRRYQSWALREARLLAGEVRPDLILALGVFEAPVAQKIAVERNLPNVTRLFGNNLSLNLHDPIRFQLNFPEVIAFRTPCRLLLLTNDGANGEEVARRLKVPPDRFRHLRNGLDFDAFTPGSPAPSIRERLGLGPRDPLLITVTRLALEKKLERAILTLDAVRRVHPNAALALLGMGPERARLEALARERGLEFAVHFPGAIHQRELPDWYRSADVVLSLLDRTNASNPVFEAMACACVVAALDTGTTREVVRPDETGVLLAARASDDSIGATLGAVLIDLLRDHERMERLGQNAARHIRSLLLSPLERLDHEVDLYEWAAGRRSEPKLRTNPAGER